MSSPIPPALDVHAADAGGPSFYLEEVITPLPPRYVPDGLTAAEVDSMWAEADAYIADCKDELAWQDHKRFHIGGALNKLGDLGAGLRGFAQSIVRNPFTSLEPVEG